MVGLILAYVWRFHALVPALEVLRISAILTLSSWALLIFRPGLKTLQTAATYPFVASYALLLLWAFVGYSFGLDPAGSLDSLQAVHIKNLVFLLFVVSTVTTFGRLKLALAANVLGAAVLSFYYIKGGTPTGWTPVSTYDRNDLALLFNMTLPIVLWFSMESTDRRATIAFRILGGALLFSVLMSQSRGGFLGLGLMFLFLMFSQKKIKLSSRLAPLLVLLVGVFFLPAEAKERLSTLLTIEDDYNVDSPTGRLEIWKRGIGYASAYPLFGVGVDNFPLAERTLSDEARLHAGNWRGTVAHNSYVEIAAETGIPGAVLYLFMIGSAFVMLRRNRTRLVRASDDRLAPLIRLSDMLSASLLGFAFGGALLSTFRLSLLVVLLALISGCIFVSSKGIRASWRIRTARTRRRTAGSVAQRSPHHRAGALPFPMGS